MAKKKTNDSSNLFKKHDNLKWLIPLFFLVAIAFIFVAKHRINDNDPDGDRSAVIKQEVKNKLMDNETGKKNDNSTNQTNTSNNQVGY